MSHPPSHDRIEASVLRRRLGHHKPLLALRGGASDQPPLRQQRPSPWSKPKKDDGNDGLFSGIESPFHVAVSLFPKWTGVFLKSMLGMTIALYVLNQKHMLPKPLSAVVSKTLFWPTLPITVSRRIGTWTTVVDDTVIMGGAPIGFANVPERLYEEYGVRGVVNLCQEYAGPVRKYDKLGMKELWLPTVDHFEPSVQDLKTAVSFIKAHQAKGDRVYVHCRAGHGRSAAAVLAWLLYQDPTVDPQELNIELCQIRNVRKSLWRQANIKEFHLWLKHGKKNTHDAKLNHMVYDNDSDTD